MTRTAARWSAVLQPPLPLVGAVVLVVTMTSFMRGPLLPEIGRDLRLGATQISLITSAFGAGRVVMDLPAGRLADRLAPGTALAGSALVVALASGLMATAQSLAQVLAATVVLGAGSALSNTTGMTVFGSAGPAATRGTAMAVFSTALMTGQMLGPALAGALADLGSWRLAQVVGLGMSLAAAVACARSRLAGAGGARRQRGTPGAAMRPAEQAALAFLAFGIFFALAALPQTLLPVLFERELAFSATAIGLALGGAGLARLAGGLVTGHVSDRFSRRAALVPMTAAMAGGIALLALPPDAGTWIVALCVLSFTSSGISVGATIVADRTDPAMVGRRLGAFRLAGDLGLLAGPITAGLLYEVAGRPVAALAVAALVAAAAVASGVLVGESSAGRERRPGRR